MTTLKEIDDRYYQYCNVVILPSNTKAQIYLNDHTLYLSNNLNIENKKFDIYQHIYITSSDEIKEGDWMLDGSFIRLITDKDYLSEAKLNSNFINWRKIIATTNLLLKIHKFKKGVLKNLEYNLPQPPLQFIEKFIEAYNNNVGIDEVLVENEKATYEKWIKNGATPVFDTLKVNSDNTINIKLIKESYTRAELIKLLNEFGEHVCNELLGHRLSMIGELNKWAEENL